MGNPKMPTMRWQQESGQIIASLRKKKGISQHELNRQLKAKYPLYFSNGKNNNPTQRYEKYGFKNIATYFLYLEFFGKNIKVIIW